MKFSRLVIGGKGVLLASLLAGVVTPQLSSAGFGMEKPQGFFDLYEQNREVGRPNLITEDFLLLGYSMIRQDVLADVEDNQIRPEFTSFIKGLAKVLAEQKGKAPATEANRDFLAVLGALLSGSDKGLPTKAAKAEHALVLAAKGIDSSPLWGYSMDYSQYKPRGRYTAGEELKRYFRAMRYAGGVLFSVKPSKATGVTPELAERFAQQAHELVSLIDAGTSLQTQRYTLEQSLAWQFGRSEDLSDEVLLQAATKEQGSLAQKLFEAAKKLGQQPRIIGGLVDKSKLEKGVTSQDVMTGWRLLPSRYSADSAAMQRMVYDATGEYTGKIESKKQRPFGLSIIAGKLVKGYPLSRELIAMLGSKSTADALEAAGEKQFKGYAEALTQGAALLGGAEGLNGAQLQFMGSAVRASDNDVRVNSLRGFWTWQRYLGLLYAKQSYTVTAKGLNLSQARKGAMLQMATPFYLALDRLVQQHRDNRDHTSWQEFADLLDQIISISFKLDQGTLLSENDESFLNGLDTALLSLTGKKDTPIVVDVHTNPAEGKVLQMAVGFPLVMGKDKARGARMSVYEFKHPLSDRLTREGWIDILQKQGT